MIDARQARFILPLLAVGLLLPTLNASAARPARAVPVAPMTPPAVATKAPAAPLAASAPASTTAQAPLLTGFNEQWDGLTALNTLLDNHDLSTLQNLGGNAVRFPVRCYVVAACTYDQRFNDSIDYRTVQTWDYTQLDAAVSQFLSAGMTPVIGPHPGDRMFRPGWIVDDTNYESTKEFVRRIVTHLNARFGPLPYSFFETELNTSLVQGADGVLRYRYRTARGFPASFAAGLSRLYGGDIAALNAAYGTSYTTFSQVPVPDLGSSAGIPAGVIDSPTTFDLRRVIAQVSASRYSAIGDLIHQASPGSQWWGPTIHLPSFHDSRQVHTATQLTPVGPTPSDLAAQPGIDVLSVDGYRNNDPWKAAAEWRIAAKLAARYGKQLAITEIGATNLDDLKRAMDGVRRGGANLRAVLIWEGKDSRSTDAFGVISTSGAVKPGYASAVRRFFSDLQAPAFRVYDTGTEAVYYPEWGAQVVQNGKLTTTKSLALAADLLAAGIRFEPVVDAELGSGTSRVSVYSLYMSEAGRAALVASGRRVVVFQYNSHRSRFQGGKPVDVPTWAGALGFWSSNVEGSTRPAETIKLLGSSYDVAADYRLTGWPFVHFDHPGTANAVIATHGATAPGYPLAIRTPAGSMWFDEYPGGAAIPAIYG